MSAYADAIARRFGDGGPSGEDAEDNEFIRRVLSRKTVRRYSGTVPDENLLDVLTAAALSASAKSDFQQASILRVRDPTKRAAIGELFPAMPGSRTRRCSSSFWAMRGGSSASARCAESRFGTERWKGSSMRASMPPSSCRP